MAERPFCFVIMPFAEELHYFYLYMRDHIEKVHHMDCERGDAQILTVPVLEKINNYIRKADVLIADCTGRNPNVFYELGIAHAHEKKVILMTKDSVADAPTDIRHFEFIRYDLRRDTDFFERLDNALRNVFVSRYESFYTAACEIFHQFRGATNAKVKIAEKRLFVSRLAQSEQTRELPDQQNAKELAYVVLPKIVEDSTEIDTMDKITAWLSQNFK
jgi:nucleoside 2-deoxyribosyltransferase